MALPVIRSKGIEAYCSDLVVDNNTWAYLLSVAGYQTAVKGVIASVLEYQSATVAAGGGYEHINRIGESYSVHYQKLPSGLYQGVILPKMALPNYEESKEAFLILAEDMPSAKALFYDHLEEKTEIPLHPTWTGWLWELFSEKDWLTPLNTIIGGYMGFLADIYPDDLKEAVAAAIRNEIPDIVKCLAKGEAYADK